jgi:hypothetical protein
MPFLLNSLRVPLTWREIFKRTFYEAFVKDNCLALAAQLAYYFFFALFPALLFMVALASYFPLTTLIDDLFRTMGGFMPPEALQLITDQMIKISGGKERGLMTLGMLLAVLSSSAAMVAVIDTLNNAYDVQEGRPWWKVRLTAVLLTVGVAVFILLSFTLVLVGPTMATTLADSMNLGPVFEWTWKILLASAVRARQPGDRIDLLFRSRCRAGMGVADPRIDLRDDALARGVARLQILRCQLGELHRNVWAHRRGHDSPVVVLHFRFGDPRRRGDERRNRACIAARQGSRREGRWPETTNPDAGHATLDQAASCPWRQSAKRGGSERCRRVERGLQRTMTPARENHDSSDRPECGERHSEIESELIPDP